MSAKRFLTVLLSCILLTSLLSACKKAESADAPELKEAVQIEYATAQVKRGNVYNFSQYDAEVKAEMQEAYFEVGGSFDRYYVQNGDEVQEGDLIAELDVADKKAQSEQLKENLESLQKNCQHKIDQCGYEIAQKEIMIEAEESEEKIQIINYELKELKAKKKYLENEYSIEKNELLRKLDAAEKSIASASLYAPYSGKVAFTENLKKNDRVSAYSPVIYIAQTDKLYVEYGGTSFLGRTTARPKAYISGKMFDLKLVEYDRSEYTALVIHGGVPPARFEFEDEEADVSAGDYAILYLYADAAEDVLYVPANALHIQGTSTGYVYLIENGEKVYREVNYGVRTEVWAEITSGLEEGDVVVVSQ